MFLMLLKTLIKKQVKIYTLKLHKLLDQENMSEAIKNIDWLYKKAKTKTDNLMTQAQNIIYLC